MTTYITKVWGFGVPIGPLQFSTQGWRENALKKLKPGDRVVSVGTTGEPTTEDMRGRLLGVMEPTSEPVMSLDFDVRKAPGDFENGEYKWPFALMNRCGWLLPERPLLSDISDRRFEMDAVKGIVPLSEEEAELVESLTWQEEDLLQPTAQAKERMGREDGSYKRTAPPPSTTRKGVMHMRSANAYTYAMRIEGPRLVGFKIGWAFDYNLRARQFNRTSMPELGGLKYKPKHFHLWDTAREAFRMEQRLLEHFASFRHPRNNEIVHGVEEKEIERVWIETFMQLMR